MKIIIENSVRTNSDDRRKFSVLPESLKKKLLKWWNKPSTSVEPEFSPSRRLLFVATALFLGWGIITFRLVGIYFGESQLMKDHLVRQQTTSEMIRPRPGDILDRNGRLLATSLEMQSLYVVPRQIEDKTRFAQKLASVVSMTPESIERKIEKYRDKGFLWIARRLEPSLVKEIHQLKLDKQTYGFRSEYKRSYPNGSLAVHLLGLRDIDGQGHGGIEQAYQKTISGRAGRRIIVRDARNRIIHLYEQTEQPVVQGKSIQLTIDLRMQKVIEQELDRLMETWQPRGCCAVLCDPGTGDILGLSSRPTFNPEDSKTFRDDAWINRAIAWAYEPGSTIKPLIVSSALRQKVVSTESTFHGHWGEYRMGNRLLHDSHSYGQLTLAEVLIKSSNIGMAQIGEKMTNAGLYESLQRFGFGLRTGSGLPGELTGHVRPLSRWNQYSTGSIPMGQELSVTPLQMIAAHSVLANGGIYQQPRFVLKIDRQDPRTDVPGLQMRLMDSEISRWVVREAMRRVMSEGTGRRVNREELDLFGKTGTSQLFDPETGRYSSKKTVCSFVCGLPAENPQLLVLVVVDQPTLGSNHYGGTVAGPTAVEILEKTAPLQKFWLASKKRRNETARTRVPRG